MGFLVQPITLQSIFGDKRTFGPITVQCVINENTTDVLTITKQPVQTGASITDHAFLEPTIFTAQMLFSDNILGNLQDIYAELLELQSNRQPFDIVTPKRIYSSMLLQSLGQTTDRHTENILSVSMTFQQVILVSVSTGTVPRSRQRNSRETEKTELKGKKKSVLLQAVNGARGL